LTGTKKKQTRRMTGINKAQPRLNIVNGCKLFYDKSAFHTTSLNFYYNSEEEVEQA
jgi:hypothetical protein